MRTQRQPGRAGILAWILIAIASVAAIADSAGGQPPATPPLDEARAPLDLDRRERVDVQLVLLDVLVLDRQGRTVAGLEAEDFDLVVDMRAVEIASLDTLCRGDAIDDPVAGEDWTDRLGTETDLERSIVLAFDYFHLRARAEAYRYARKALDRFSLGGERHMLVSLGETLQVEVPFTTDDSTVIDGLNRMERDATLYAGNTGRLSDHRFYRQLESLLDLLETRPGRKVVVLFTEPFALDGFFHDVQFRAIAAMAASSRTAIYPVDAGGVRPSTGFRYGDLGAPPRLSRLAQETGGRVTHNTNDLAIGYARAQRDLGCTYTIGFHDRDPRLDRPRRVGVFVRQRATHVVHPNSYVIRSIAGESQARARTALTAPDLFDSGGLSTSLSLVGPRSRSRWDAEIRVDLSAIDREGLEDWTVRAELRNARGTRIRNLRGRWPDDAADAVVVEAVRVPPGDYRLTAALSHAERSIPFAAEESVHVPNVPRDETFVVGPRFGRAVSSGFEPLPGSSVAQGRTVVSRARICRLNVGENPVAGTVRRLLLSGMGEVAIRFDPEPLSLGPGRGPSCQEVVDSLPTAGLPPGTYSLEIVVEETGGSVHGARGRFEVTATGTDPD